MIESESKLELIQKFLRGIAPQWRRKPTLERVSKHMGANNIRATKLYANDRQKMPHNRRKHGRNK